MGEQIQLALAIATFPIAADFIRRYAKPSERWWATPMGWSIMLMSLAVLTWTMTVILFRILGPYPGRDFLITFMAALAFAAMVSRHYLLTREQRRDRERRRDIDPE